MGNGKSSNHEIQNEETIEICEYWTLESVTLADGFSKACVFKQNIQDESKAQKLQSLSQNLKLYRHPNILRFVSSWQSNGILYVTTEDVKPFTFVRDNLLPMQLCIGLRNILNAVLFLQQTGCVSINNLSVNSVYVNNEGCWKLGRLESLSSSQPSHITNDQQGFATFALEVLEEVKSDDVPGLLEFKDYCTHNALDSNFFLQLLSKSFFNHEFIRIYTFLVELPIKCEEEKSLFFKSLVDNLIPFSEKLVAEQLGSLLLSRLVLLNEVAQSHLLPKLFIAKSDHFQSLFSLDILKEYFQSKLLHMFGLRDSQIRLILLRYFSSLCSIFTKQQLELKILPELLTGVKDTNEYLVTATLHGLADLVPILGASVVVGQHRTKLFADGRPLTNLAKEEKLVSGSEVLSASTYILTERPSPDGGEDFKQSSNVANEMASDNNVEAELIESEPVSDHSSAIEKKNSTLSLSAPKKKIFVSYDDDLSSLDVKCSRAKKEAPSDDIDLLFKDMEPVIRQTAKMNINEVSEVRKSKFEAADVDFGTIDGWEDDVSDLIDADDLL